MMAEDGEKAMLVAGGTDLFPNLKRRQFEPEVLVQVPHLPGIRRDDGHFALGATVSVADRLRACELALEPWALVVLDIE